MTWPYRRSSESACSSSACCSNMSPRDSARTAGSFWCGVSSSRRSPSITAPTRSIRCRMCSAASATRPAMPAAITCWLALITLGEGWHNNHHHYPASVRQGFYWWEFDITFYMLKLMSFFGRDLGLETGAVRGPRRGRQALLTDARRDCNGRCRARLSRNARKSQGRRRRRRVARSPGDIAPYTTDFRGLYHGATPLVLLPRDAWQVSRILAICNRDEVAVVPHGGNTSYCGGADARMNRARRSCFRCAA